MRRDRLLTLSALLAAGVLSGCSSLVTTTAYAPQNLPNTCIGDSAHAGCVPDGVAYYLPKTLVKVVLTRKAVPADNVKKTAMSAEEARTKEKEAKAAAADARAKAETAKEVAKTNPGGAADGVAKEKADLLDREATVAKKRAETATRQAEEAQAKAEAAVAERGAAKEYEDEIALTEVPGVPDTERVYVANVKHLWTRRDQVVITTTAAGLLRTTTGESEDKTGAILQDVAKVAIGVFKAITITPFAKSRAVEEKIHACARDVQRVPGIETRAFTLELVFDPTEPGQSSIQRVNDELCRVASNFILTLPEPVVASSSVHLADKTTVPGLVYRRPIPLVIQLRMRYMDDCDGAADCSYAGKAFQLSIPNRGPLAAVSLEAGPFVTTKYDVGFENGMLTKLDANRPSELHEAVQIPLSIIKDIVALPTELLQLKIDYSTKDTKLLEQQKANAEAREALRKALEDIRNASTSTSE